MDTAYHKFKLQIRIWTGLLLLLSLWQFGSAQDLEKMELSEGRLPLRFGTLSFPETLEWRQKSVEKGQLFEGKNATQTVVVLALEKLAPVDNTGLNSLIESYLNTWFSPKSERLVFESTSRAPYPWADSLEVRIKKPHSSVYLGSGSGCTLMVAVLGPNASENANYIAGSFKESFGTKHLSQAVEKTKPQILTMLGTASTFLIVTGLFVPLAVVIFRNRKEDLQRPLFPPMLKGLHAAMVMALICNYAVLSRISWINTRDFLDAFTSSLSRYLFCLIILLYLSHRQSKLQDCEPPSPT